MCIKEEMLDRKGRRNNVVKKYCVRGAMTTTRLRVLVVRPVVSCLGDNVYVGIDIKDCSSENWRIWVISWDYGG